MKLKITTVIVLAALSFGCGEEKPPEIAPEVLSQIVKTGEAQAVVKLIKRAQAAPCQPIYLFNNIDENNKQEVNLINIACENLNLPQIPNTEEADIKPE